MEKWKEYGSYWNWGKHIQNILYSKDIFNKKKLKISANTGDGKYSYMHIVPTLS